MKVLENSPVEALALNYLSFGFLSLLNNFWTWLAFSFWKDRVRSSQPELLPPGPSTSDSPGSGPEVSDPGVLSVVTSSCNCAPVAVAGNGVDVDGVTKGKLKFTLHYNYEDDDTTECDSGGGVLTVEEEEWEEEEWWKRLLKMRRGECENGWYTYQDLTVVNGNVVRFWDDATSTTNQAQPAVRVW